MNVANVRFGFVGEPQKISACESRLSLLLKAEISSVAQIDQVHPVTTYLSIKRNEN